MYTCILTVHVHTYRREREARAVAWSSSVGFSVHCAYNFLIFCYSQQYWPKLPSLLKGREGSSLAYEALLGTETNLVTLVFLMYRLIIIAGEGETEAL